MIGMIILCAKNETYTECVLCIHDVFSHDWDDHVVRKKNETWVRAKKKCVARKTQFSQELKRKRSVHTEREHIIYQENTFCIKRTHSSTTGRIEDSGPKSLPTSGTRMGPKGASLNGASLGPESVRSSAPRPPPPSRERAASSSIHELKVDGPKCPPI
jgi:hypothetical protein